MKTMDPGANKFHVGNGDDGKHYWLTPPALYDELNAQNLRKEKTLLCHLRWLLRQRKYDRE